MILDIKKMSFPHFVLGGVASGKSKYAESIINQYAIEHKMQKYYIATAENIDCEINDKIKKHISRRGDSWNTIECPIDIASELSSINDRNNIILIDCITMWLGNLYHHQLNIKKEVEKLTYSLQNITAKIVIVSCETGLGIIGADKLSRSYCNDMGMINQQFAMICKDVTMVVAGLPLSLKNMN